MLDIPMDRNRLKIRNPAAFSTGIAHALAWVVVVWLIFAPFYQGESVTAVNPSEIPNEPTKTTATLFDINGWGLLPVVLLPVGLTGLALLSFLQTRSGQPRHKIIAWILAALLLGACVLGSFTIGLFYLPSALALLLAAILISGSRRVETIAG